MELGYLERYVELKLLDEILVVLHEQQGDQV